MNLSQALNGLNEAPPDAQTPERPDVQTPKRPDSQTAERLTTQTPNHSDAQTAKRSDVQAAKRSDRQTPKRPAVQASERSGLPLQGTAKSKHPDFEKKTLYLRAATCKRAGRKWEDADCGDFSDLVEALLQAYVEGGLHA